MSKRKTHYKSSSFPNRRTSHNRKRKYEPKEPKQLNGYSKVALRLEVPNSPANIDEIVSSHCLQLCILLIYVTAMIRMYKCLKS